jgi:hypothetical protein
MKMIDVREGKESVERSIDRSGYFVLAVGGKRIVVHHLVFVRFASIQTFQGFKSIEVNQCKTGFLDGAEIAPATLHSQNANLLACEWVRQGNFGAGIATAEICDSQVCAQEVGAISEQSEFILAKGCGVFVVPQILQE